MIVPEIPSDWVIRVQVDGPGATRGRLAVGGWSAACVVGRNGLVDPAAKQEGDGCTPTGCYPLRYGFYRPDRLGTAWPAGLRFPFCPAVAVPGGTLDYVWDDAPGSPSYNRLAAVAADTPHAERLRRSADDHVYDVCIPIGYNDAAAVPGKGSGIFLHQTRPDFRPTDGCVAVSAADMLALLPRLQPGMLIEIG